MKQELIAELFYKFEQACYVYKDLECWSARELQEILGYSKWENFLNVVLKAKKACTNAGSSISDHFADVGKKVVLGSGAERNIDDIALTRYACYLIAQNGDHQRILSPLHKRISQFKPGSKRLLSKGCWM